MFGRNLDFTIEWIKKPSDTYYYRGNSSAHWQLPHANLPKDVFHLTHHL
jgi:hypothetical protein